MTFVPKFVGFEPEHAIFENIIIAFFRRALIICGARDVHAEFTTLISEGGPYAELSVTWN
jgi:hypothetical protein